MSPIGKWLLERCYGFDLRVALMIYAGKVVDYPHLQKHDEIEQYAHTLGLATVLRNCPI